MLGMSSSFVPSTAASASAERSSLYRNTPSQSDATHVQLLCSWCLVHRFMLTDGVCSLCPGQKLQNVNVPDKWLNVETVDCSSCSIRSADIPRTSVTTSRKPLTYRVLKASSRKEGCVEFDGREQKTTMQKLCFSAAPPDHRAASLKSSTALHCEHR